LVDQYIWYLIFWGSSYTL